MAINVSAPILPKQVTNFDTSTAFPLIHSTIFFGKNPQISSSPKTSRQSAKSFSISNIGRPIRTGRLLFIIDLCKICFQKPQICFQKTSSEKYSLHLSHTDITEITEFVCLAANGSHPFISHVQFSKVPNRKKYLFFSLSTGLVLGYIIPFNPIYYILSTLNFPTDSKLYTLNSKLIIQAVRKVQSSFNLTQKTQKSRNLFAWRQTVLTLSSPTHSILNCSQPQKVFILQFIYCSRYGVYYTV